MTNLRHRETALAHLDAVEEVTHHLKEIYSGPQVDRREVAAGYDAIRQGLKTAEIHALLAVADAIAAASNQPQGVRL